MPWDDIIRELRENYLDQKLLDIPRRQACLWHLIRVNMNVAGHDLHKHIRQLRVRPYAFITLSRMFDRIKCILKSIFFNDDWKIHTNKKQYLQI